MVCPSLGYKSCYHRIIKSGCRVESRQLENASRLRNALAIDMIIAWRIHYLTTLGHETPDVPCTVYFSESEWKALTTFTNKTKTPPDTPPSLNEAVSLLGKLGGHLAAMVMVILEVKCFGEGWRDWLILKQLTNFMLLSFLT